MLPRMFRNPFPKPVKATLTTARRVDRKTGSADRKRLEAVPTGRSRNGSRSKPIQKAPSGIRGLDEIMSGGLPRGRPTLICGSAGCGKTLFALEFLIRGVTEFDEPGVCVTFEERPADLAANVASLGFDLPALEAKGRIVIDHVQLDPAQIEETGEYNLDGLFIRLQHAVDSSGAKRVVLDTIEALFGGLSNLTILRSELQRLFMWLKERGLTTVITAERGDGQLTRAGLEEYVSDCVILLDHRVSEEISTRRLRIVKYRGSTHGTNEYPFLIDEQGFSVLPLSAVGLDHEAPKTRISTGVERLDQMLDGDGYYRGSTVLISGTAGAGKSTFAASFAAAAARRGERSLYVAFEEAPQQIMRNMRSIGLDLAPQLKRGSLRIEASRPYQHSLEAQLVRINKMVQDWKPAVVVIDPLSNLIAGGAFGEVRSMATRLIDMLKAAGVTACFTALTSGHVETEQTDLGISSLIDTWIVLRTHDESGERNRLLTIVKSRGMPHSNQSCEFVMSREGVELVDTYLGPAGVLTGSMRLAQEAREKAALRAHSQDVERQRHIVATKQRAFEARLAQLEADHQSEVAELQKRIAQAEAATVELAADRRRMASSRQAFSVAGNGRRGGL
jgi:circadian clock protein KaiC